MSSDSSIEIPDENPPPTSPSAISSPSSTHAALSGDEAQSGPHTPQQSETGEELLTINNRTPTQLKVSTRQVAPKDKPYVPMMVQEMTHRHHEMALDDFIFYFAKVSALEDKIPGLFEDALEKMSKFEGLNGCTDEAQMYKHLVSLAYCTVQQVSSSSLSHSVRASTLLLKRPRGMLQQARATPSKILRISLRPPPTI